MTDAELVRLAAHGAPDALATLLERHRASLYATAIGLLRNREDALDAVQETAVVALAQLGRVRDPDSVRGWLHAVLRNVCLMRIRRCREIPSGQVEVTTVVPGPEQALEAHAMRDWIWDALAALSSDEALSLILRYFSRCSSYQNIAEVTGVPVGTVRSRLNRARARLATALLQTAGDAVQSHARLETERLAQWQGFYDTLHQHPVPHTYRDLFAPDVEVDDRHGHWSGIQPWSVEEREAIDIGVRATIVGVAASRDITVLEVDFTNPADFPDHCPPKSTFVHRLEGARSRQLNIHYSVPSNQAPGPGVVSVRSR